MSRHALAIVMMIVMGVVLPHCALADSDEPQLGVFLQELDDDLREHFAFKGNGVLITGVVEDTGADRAGLKNQDIIIEINGERTGSISDVRSEVKKTRPGDKIQMAIYRDKSKKNILLEVTAKKSRSAWHYPRKWVQFMGSDQPWIGIRMQELTPQLAEYFKAEFGVLIAGVMEDSPAERAGLKAGDVIVAWDERKTEDKKSLLRRLSRCEPGDEVTITIVRGGEEAVKPITPVKPKVDDNRLFGFSFDQDDTGDIIFRMRNMPPRPYFHLGPDSDREKPHGEWRLRMGNHNGEMKELKEELQQLKEELEELKSKKQY